MDFKKLFITFAVFAAVSLVSFSFTSCGSEDDDPVKGQTPKSAMALYQFEASQDMIDLLDITISYVDKGEIHTETMTSTKWTATANGLVLPATFGYKIHMKVKDNADFSKGSFDFVTNTYTTQYAVYDQDGKRIEALSKKNSAGTQRKLTGLNEEGIRKAYTDREYKQEGFEIDTDGKYATTTIKW